MGFKDMIKRTRATVLCSCKDDNRKPSLEIGLPTDARRNVLPMSGLSKEQEELIREKAPTDAARLIALSSHPPTSAFPPVLASPSRSHPSNHSSPSSSLASSREPSMALLNSASVNLPTSVPTPPRRKHSDTHVPSTRPSTAKQNDVPSPSPSHIAANTNLPSSAHSRMKGFWERSAQRTRRLSNALSVHSVHSMHGHSLHGHNHNGYAGISKDEEDGVVLLNLDFKDSSGDLQILTLGSDGLGPESPGVESDGKSIAGKSLADTVTGRSVHVDVHLPMPAVECDEGFECQDTVGGAIREWGDDGKSIRIEEAKSIRIGAAGAGEQKMSKGNGVVARAMREIEAASASSSDDEDAMGGAKGPADRVPLVAHAVNAVKV